MQENWVEIMDRAQQLAPDVPGSRWREIELAMRGWAVAQEAAGYRVEVEDVVRYARSLAAMGRARRDRATASETEARTLPKSA